MLFGGSVNRLGEVHNHVSFLSTFWSPLFLASFGARFDAQNWTPKFGCVGSFPRPTVTLVTSPDCRLGCQCCHSLRLSFTLFTSASLQHYIVACGDHPIRYTGVDTEKWHLHIDMGSLAQRTVHERLGDIDAWSRNACRRSPNGTGVRGAGVSQVSKPVSPQVTGYELSN